MIYILYSHTLGPKLLSLKKFVNIYIYTKQTLNNTTILHNAHHFN